MRLVDELERTAAEYDAPNELIRDIPALAAVYFDKEAAAGSSARGIEVMRV